MPQSSALFNKSHLQAHRLRAEKENKSGADFLLRWAEMEMRERLSDIKREFGKALLLSPAPSQTFTAFLLNKAEEIDTRSDIDLAKDEIFPCEPNSYDLIVSFFDLHHINDLVGWLIQIRKSLKEDGAFIACMTGGETLHELRQSMMLSEIEVMGGASPRVLPFATKQQMGDLMQRVGFTLPVVDSETITGSYRDLYHLMSDLRAMGETNCLTDRYKSFTPSRLFYEASNLYTREYTEKDGRIAATFEIIFMIGWSPADTQQKPLHRGSGQIRLSSVLEE
ncbi:MAG TPA: methyltransferase domain-containing protein [Alphaproteobacteria bacterium]|nr:methyltransferase domain-containing protein [Alphaproteobacteria bacterium]HNS44562.1 methyltransferase domain-containing protein [Alphaproteobacteria bacterium]